jgi:hypothetical protein
MRKAAVVAALLVSTLAPSVWADSRCFQGAAEARDACVRRQPRGVPACMSSFQEAIRDCQAADLRDAAATVAARDEQAARAKRLVTDRAELSAISARLKSLTEPQWWEDRPDAELGGLTESTVADAARSNELAIELGNDRPFSEADLASLRTTVAAKVAKERACRADKKCMAGRVARKAEAEFFEAVVSPMCMADQQREAAQEDMARERRNPSGYVNTIQLHEDGEQVLNAEDELKRLSAAYAKFRHHGWRGWRSECRAPSDG